jgi:hypothetical protein
MQLKKNKFSQTKAIFANKFFALASLVRVKGGVFRFRAKPEIETHFPFFYKQTSFSKTLVTCLLFITLLSSTSCKRDAKVKEVVITPEQAQAVPDDFLEFYKKFHSDSAYQMAHIQFPLEGFPSQADSAVIASGNFRWTAETWRMHRMEAFSDTAFTRTFLSPLPEMVGETLRQKNTPFAMYRRFYKRGNDWNLIFYSDMNAMKE